MKKFLLLGCTGVGKSSFINAAFGKYIAATSPYEACTKIVEHYAYNTPLGDLCLIDTPGLAEGDRKIDEAYLNMMQKKVSLSQIESFLYLSRLDETRLRSSEQQTLLLLTNYLGRSIWNKSYLVFTFAASVTYEKRKEKAQIRSRQITDFLDMQSPSKNNSIKRMTEYFTQFRGIWITDNIVSKWTEKGEYAFSLLM